MTTNTASPYNATLVERIQITSDLLIVRVKPDAPIPDFLPGQYVAIGLLGSAHRPAGAPPAREEAAPDKLIKRAYSIGSSPSEKGYLEFYVAIVPDGTLTSRLVLLKEGDRLYVAPKVTGTFILEGAAKDANLVLVATGTGLAPFMAMIKTPETWAGSRSITILHGVRHATDLAYREELEAWSKREPRLRYVPVVSRDPAWTGQKGHVTRIIRDDVIACRPGTEHVYLCGNPAMIDELETYLTTEKSFKLHSRKQAGELHLEKYW